MVDAGRVERCIIALHDLGSREKATTRKVIRQLKKDGFTTNEIVEAVKSMIGGDNA